MYQNDSSYRCLISIKYCIITERGENMLDLQKHKEYLWKYLLTYGKARKKREDYRGNGISVFIINTQMTSLRTYDTY